jgi:hypothetical protein
VVGPGRRNGRRCRRQVVAGLGRAKGLVDAYSFSRGTEHPLLEKKLVVVRVIHTYDTISPLANDDDRRAAFFFVSTAIHWSLSPARNKDSNTTLLGGSTLILS